MEYSKLGKELEIYTSVDYIGKGFPIILPNGAKMIKILREMVEDEEEKRGYMIVRTPSASRAEIYMIEDRWEQEKDEIFTIEAEEEQNSIVLRPYVRPFHCSLYATKQHSYKELPIKYGETSTVFRDEPTSKIRGLTCMRQYSFSDASIFTSPELLEKTLKESVEIEKYFMDKLDLNVEYKISTWNTSKKEEYIGTINEWNMCAIAMEKALNESKITYTKNQDAKMYGPSIQVYYNSKLLAKIEIDFEITHRFDLKYTDKDGLEKFPLYIHRQDLGSYESMLAILIEKYQGEFPTWIAPVQCIIIPEYDEYIDYANQMKDKLRERRVRVSVDFTDKGLDEKIEKAKKFKIPYIVLIGKEEYNSNKVSVIRYDKKDIKHYTLEEVMQRFERRR